MKNHQIMPVQAENARVRHSLPRHPSGVSGGGNMDENRRFENLLSLTVKKQTTDSGSCRLVLRLA